MLKPISRVPCWDGLQAGFDLQVSLARWLCEPTTKKTMITKAGIAHLHANTYVNDWLWSFLHPRSDQTRLLKAAKTVATQPSAEKLRLRNWIDVVQDVGAQFRANSSAWPTVPDDLPKWGAFTELMQAFYEKFDSIGLPFDSSGNAVKLGGVTYSQFVAEFKQRHSEQVCVLCEGPLGRPQVDHWIAKANYPLLSIAPHNLIPICYECNVAPCKGYKPTYAIGAAAFGGWFHPHYYSGHGRVSMRYDAPTLAVQACAINDQQDKVRVEHLDQLINLSSRWTKEFKAEYRNHQKSLRQLIGKGYFQATDVDIRNKLAEWKDTLVNDRQHFTVHALLLSCAQDPERLRAWVAEL